MMPVTQNSNLTDYALSTKGNRLGRQKNPSFAAAQASTQLKANTNLQVASKRGVSSALNLDLQTGAIKAGYTSQGQAKGRSSINIVKPSKNEKIA